MLSEVYIFLGVASEIISGYFICLSKIEYLESSEVLKIS